MKYSIPVLISVAAVTLAGKGGAQTSNPIILPDPQKVTAIKEAAKICLFDDVGLDWAELSPDTVRISLSVVDMQMASPAAKAFRDCFMGWAYDRNVKVDMAIKQ